MRNEGRSYLRNLLIIGLEFLESNSDWDSNSDGLGLGLGLELFS